MYKKIIYKQKSAFVETYTPDTESLDKFCSNIECNVYGNQNTAYIAYNHFYQKQIAKIHKF